MRYGVAKVCVARVREVSLDEVWSCQSVCG